MNFLLVTDLDNTLVGDDTALLRLNQKLLANRDRLYLIYATGRSYALARQLQKEQNLIEPDYWLTGVGTEIYRKDERDPDWAERLSQGWNRDSVAALASGFPDLILQPETEQNPWKLSFLIESERADTVLANLQALITQAGLKAQIIFSNDENVDILPKKGDKGLAMTYLREKLGIPPEKTLVCGDSGNDISLFQQNTLGLIVSNSRSELLAWYRLCGESRHYRSRARFAGGILEAIDHFKLMPPNR
ncbi:MAG TPA: sucrose-phosphate phosphatase [Coleofasciculaceae cyanobacterium]